LKPFDASGAFQGTRVDGQLRRRAVRSAGVTVLSQGAVFGVQLVSTVVLARLLTPADFGVVTMVTTFSLLIMSFGLNGYTEAVLQREDINHALASNLFWINIGVGVAATVGFAASGSLLSKFYGDPRVANVAIGLSLTILISSTSVVHLALLKRALSFSVTSANDIVATAASVALSILLAWRGWGYWALVVGMVARLALQSLGAWLLCSWLPSFPQRVPGTASVVWFATHVYGRYSLNYCTRNTDNLLVGWRFGSGSLGFYKKAYDLFLLPANQLLAPVCEVVLSTLSKLDRHSAQYRRYFLNGLSILAFVGMGIGAAMTLMGKDIIRLLLGPQWDPAGQIFTFFGPGIGIMLVYSTHGLIHLSIGRADRWLRWVFVEFSVTASLFLLGLHWGPVGVAAAWTASFWILTVPGFWYAGQPIHFSVGPMISAVWRYMAASLLAGGVTGLIMRTVSFLAVRATALGAFTRILEISSIFSVLYLGAVILLHGGPEPLLGFARLLPDVLPFRIPIRSLSRDPRENCVEDSQGSRPATSEQPSLLVEQAK
jgi:O-antigen/teichoic acid export membrane protein